MSTLLSQMLSRRLYRTGLIIAIGMVTVVGILISFSSTLSSSVRASGYDYLRKELIEAHMKTPKTHQSAPEAQGDQNSSSYKRGTCRSSTWGPEWTVDSNGGVCKHGQLERNGCCSVASNIPISTQSTLSPRQLDGMRYPLAFKSEDRPEGSIAKTEDEIPISSPSSSTNTPNTHMNGIAEGDKLESMPTCSTEHQCCAQYEYCVSSCLEFTWQRLHSTVIHVKTSDSKDSEKSFDSVTRLLGDHQAEDTNVAKEYAATLDLFDWCLLRCRTSGRSIVHQNSFRSNLKHCYGVKDPPLLARNVEDGESQ